VATAVAQAAADQLVVAGVDATVSLLPSAALYGSALSSGAVDLVVGRAAAGGDLGTTLASRFGCPTTTGPTAPSTTAPPTTSAGTSTSSAADPTATLRSGNVSGLCDPQIESRVQQALTGAADAADVAAELEPLLWDQGAVLPLYQDSVLLSVRSDVSGVNPPGPLLAGPVAGAATWTRTAP